VGPRVKGCIAFVVDSTELARALYSALKVEAENPPDTDRASVSLSIAERTVSACFHARDPSSARAIVNAYLSLAAATIEALRRLTQARPEAGSNDGSKATT
jgi:tRNA threonylcarbamoyladenosine modification (KEOPS) complex  Pcc1 subunit